MLISPLVFGILQGWYFSRFCLAASLANKGVHFAVSTFVRYLFLSIMSLCLKLANSSNGLSKYSRVFARAAALVMVKSESFSFMSISYSQHSPTQLVNPLEYKDNYSATSNNNDVRTLAVDGWAAKFGTARRELGGSGVASGVGSLSRV